MRALPQKPYKPYIVPTLYGLAYFFLILNVFALGYYRNSSPFHTVALTMSILGLVAMIQSNDGIKGLKATALSCEPTAVGQLTALRLSLESEGPEAHYNLWIETEKTWHAKAPLRLPFLEQTAIVDVELAAPRRGIYQLTRVKVFSRGLFNLFYTWTWLPIAGELVVYPRSRGSQPLPLSSEDFQGMRAVGDDFAGHRAYQAGVSPRLIDWKALARRDLLLLKDYQQQGEGAVHLSLDAVKVSDPEARLEQLTAWCFACRAQERPFSLDLRTSALSRGSGDAHLSEALRLLAAYQEPT